ncbi:uncharacterized protein LOC111596403 [Drosophila hydei]|uniref:Uncharacterized protein LOC111596403 n=1 Tax=Drosophila hydei TaxID=7224 RepID=A0A6J1LRL0_DROHY|nr:uncharacterized protein LOC111596403 [Drosophila hydei]
MKRSDDFKQNEEKQAQKRKKKVKHTHSAIHRNREKRKVSVERLFYAPRRTCRQRQADEECAPCELPGEPKTDVCCKCGIELTPLPQSEPTSNIDLGLPTETLDACVRNEQVLQAVTNICEMCSLVHKPHTLCPTFDTIGDGTNKFQQQLHLIKHHARCRLPERCNCCCSYCCQPAAKHCRSSELNA